MPLTKSASPKAVGHNVKEMVAAGHPYNQSLAAALRTQDEARRGKKQKKGK